MAKREKRGYKVLIRYACDKMLFSAFVRADIGGIEYTEGQWTKRVAGNGPLGVCRTLDDARFIAQSVANYPEFDRCIYRCSYIKSRARRFWFLRRYWASPDWRTSKHINYRISDIPAGTIFADAVKLTSEVKKND